MRAVVVYESLFGNTGLIARAVAAGLESFGDVALVPVGEASEEVVRGADLLVVGGPTHAHGMSWAKTRQSGVDMDKGAEWDGGPGIREWLKAVPVRRGAPAATFDTRIDKPRVLVGSAAVGASRRLSRRGYRLVVPAESFFVDDVAGPLRAGEEDRARAWAADLARAFVAA